MVVGVTSINQIKLDAVKRAFHLSGIKAKVVGFPSNSGVGENPVNEKTLEGARNRIKYLKKRLSEFDYIVSIENGLFREDEKWLDKGVVVIFNPKTKEEFVEYSDSVPIPSEYVEKAKKIGFEKITVGKVMQRAGVVSNDADPHVSITGIPRQKYLEETIKKLIKKIKEEKGNE